MKHWLILIIFG